MQNLLVSVSGGRSSARMAKHINESPKYKDFNKLFVFANTGLEKEEALIFVREMGLQWGIDIKWIEAVVPMVYRQGIEAMEINYQRASRYGQPFAAVIKKYNLNKKYGVPNLNAPYCSDRLKKTPIHKYAKEYFNAPYLTALGMRAEDMPKRISWAEIEQSEDYIYPLITDFQYPLTQTDIERMLKKTGLDLGIFSVEGNCAGCWKKSRRKTIDLMRMWNGERWQWWIDQEEIYESEDCVSTFHRGNISVKELLEMASAPTTGNLFDQDENIDCFCG